MTKAITERPSPRAQSARSIVACCLWLALAAASVARADQEGEDPWAGIEEMVVVGSGVAGLIADPTTSTVEFDAGDLEDIGAQDISDLARFTPSLEINTTAATTPTFFIRGVGLNDQNSNAAGAIAIYVDNVPMNSAAIQLTSLYDSETVEVLRGPQGFGDARNASGGLINTISKKPTGEHDAFIRGDVGNFGYYDVEGAVGAPIFRDEVAMRFAFRRTFRDDLIQNRCGNLPVPDTGPGNSCNESGTRTGGEIPAGLPSETNDVDRYAWRTQFLIRPEGVSTEMEWLLNVHHARIDQSATVGQAIGRSATKPQSEANYIDPVIEDRWLRYVGIFRAQGLSARDAPVAARDVTLEQITRNIDLTHPFENDYDLGGFERLTQWGGTVRGDVELGPVVLETVTGVERWDRETLTDFDFSSAPMIHLGRQDDAIQFSENLELEMELESLPIVLNVGGFTLVELLDSESSFFLKTRAGLAATRDLRQDYEQELYSWGLFAGAVWEPVEEFTIEAGARINWERKEFALDIARVLPNVAPRVGSTEERRTWSAPTYGVNFTYNMTEDILAFWKYTRGWKSGHFNASVITIPGQDDPVIPTNVAQPETIDSVEFGIDADLVGGAIHANVAAFYYRYDNYQVFLLQSQNGSAPQLEILNANTAQTYGIEADVKLRPFDFWPSVPEAIQNLTFSANFAWLESEFLDFSTNRVSFLPSDPLAPNPEINIASQTVDFTGNRLPNTPKFKLSATAEWAIDLGAFGVVTPRYDITWTDDIFFDPSQGVGTPRFGASADLLPEYAIGQRAYARHDFRVTYATAEGGVSISGWVRNATNEVFKRNVLDLSVAFGQISNYIGDPRTYGVSASVTF